MARHATDAHGDEDEDGGGEQIESRGYGLPAVAATDVIRRRLLVRGRVQGVWFRDSCQQQALRWRVNGWARNMDDGRVEVVLEGDAGGVAEIERWCHAGPARAVVTDVLAFTEQPEGLTAFRVR
jgi:acylphosphatase